MNPYRLYFDHFHLLQIDMRYAIQHGEIHSFSYYVSNVSGDRHVIRRISTLRPAETVFNFRSLSIG